MDILDYLKSKGYNPKPVGSIYRMLCPYPDHKETIGSFTIYPKTNSFFCWGCKRSGNVTTLMRLFGDPITVDLLEEERERINKIKEKKLAFKDKLTQIRGLITTIRNKRKTYANQEILNRRVRRIMKIMKEYL